MFWNWNHLLWFEYEMFPPPSFCFQCCCCYFGRVWNCKRWVLAGGNRSLVASPWKCIIAGPFLSHFALSPGCHDVNCSALSCPSCQSVPAMKKHESKWSIPPLTCLFQVFLSQRLKVTKTALIIGTNTYSLCECLAICTYLFIWYRVMNVIQNIE
jgi:hypothetical protein